MPPMDHALCTELSQYIEMLTTKGSKELDAGVMKKLKNICRIGDDYVKQAYYLVMTQMEMDHSQVRYSALLVMDELFRRSHAFRELLLSGFQKFLEHTVETDPDLPLPPPDKVAKELKAKALGIIQQWYEQYKDGYKKLVLGYNYLKICKKVDFNDMLARTVSQRRQEVEETRRRELFSQKKAQKASEEMEEQIPEATTVLTQMENCFRLLMPHPDEFFTEADFNSPQTSVSTPTKEQEDASNCKPAEIEDKDNSQVSDENEIVKHHGLGTMKFSLDIVAPTGNVTVKPSEDNNVVLENLCDLHHQVESTLMPAISRWIKVFTIHSSNPEHLRKAVALKQRLQASMEKFKDIRVEKQVPSSSKQPQHNSSDEDDFEEVKEKEGYEPNIPQHLRKEYGLEPLDGVTQLTKVPLKTEAQWNLHFTPDDVKDPTSHLCNLSVLSKKLASCAQPRSSSASSKPLETNPAQSKSDDNAKSELLSKAPRRPYDIDLYHWEEENLQAPTFLRYESGHRFWQPYDNDLVEYQPEDGVASLRTRVIEFSGEFVPVKWSCRAPLPSGKLCPRRDRYKCPLHGVVIPRDEQGNPIKSSNSETEPSQNEQPSTSKEEPVPDWQDPELLKELEAATGINLKMPPPRGKGKGKGQGKASKGKPRKRYPGLTDVDLSENTARKRLEKKVLNRSSVKRVAATLDSLDQKKFRDKFGNQWNYMYNL